MGRGLAIFFNKISQDKKQDKAYPDIIRDISEVIVFKKGRQETREIKVKIAKRDKELASSESKFMGCWLIKERGMAEDKNGNHQAYQAGYFKKCSIYFFPVMDEKVSDQNDTDPG